MSKDRTVSALGEAFARRALPSPDERRQIRQESGLSQRRIGAELGVSGQAVALWEKGDRQPRGEHLVRYALLLADLRELAGSVEQQ